MFHIISIIKRNISKQIVMNYTYLRQQPLVGKNVILLRIRFKELDRQAEAFGRDPAQARRAHVAGSSRQCRLFRRHHGRRVRVSAEEVRRHPEEERRRVLHAAHHRQADGPAACAEEGRKRLRPRLRHRRHAD